MLFCALLFCLLESLKGGFIKGGDLEVDYSNSQYLSSFKFKF